MTTEEQRQEQQQIPFGDNSKKMQMQKQKQKQEQLQKRMRGFFAALRMTVGERAQNDRWWGGVAMVGLSFGGCGVAFGD
jgi:hypothetical protein